MRITTLCATAVAVVALGSVPALAATPLPSAPVTEPATPPTTNPTDEPVDTEPDSPTSAPDSSTSDTPIESTPEPSPTRNTTEQPSQPITPSSVKNRGNWYQALVDGKPAPTGSTFSAVERQANGTVKRHDFTTGDNGKVFRVDTNEPQNKGEAVNPRVVTLKIKNGSVEFINEPAPTTPTSPTPAPEPPTEDGKTPPRDDDSQKPPRPKPPVAEPPVNTPPEEDGRQPGDRSDTPGGKNNADDTEGRNKPSGKDRTRDPDTGNGTVPGQAGTDWTPGSTGNEQTRAPDYSDPVPQNPDDAGEVSEDTIAGPEPSYENHTSAATDPSKDSTDAANDSGETDGSFPWSLAALVGVGAIGLLLAAFLFARRKSED